jgi:tRNA modification GTPase
VYERDTIAAIATPPGQGGVAIIRISGSEAEAVACRMFIFAQTRDRLVSHHLYFGQISDPLTTQPLDQGLLTLMRAPHSYTGEDVAELHCHGGSLLSQRILSATLSQGVRLAEPGEFTKRAFLNGRLDLSQAEAVLDLIQAKSEPSLHLAWEQLSGRLSETCAAIRDRLLGLTAYIEAFIDFPEDDIPARAYAEMANDVAVLTQDIATLKTSFMQGKVYREGLRTAIVGKPNVGKSSLLNALVGTERAIVTSVPGTTRDVLEETVVLNGVPLVIWDTAGLRETTNEVERIGVERARAGAQAAELVLAVFDASCAFDKDDITICDITANKTVIPVLNKVDLPAAWSAAELEARFPANPPVCISAKHGTGITALGARILGAVWGSPDAYGPPQQGDAVVSRTRHRDALAKAEESMRQVNHSLTEGLPLDIVAVDLHAALDHIGEITGHVQNEDILDRIFHDFCVGK